MCPCPDGLKVYSLYVASVLSFSHDRACLSFIQIFHNSCHIEFMTVKIQCKLLCMHNIIEINKPEVDKAINWNPRSNQRCGSRRSMQFCQFVQLYRISSVIRQVFFLPKQSKSSRSVF